MRFNNVGLSPIGILKVNIRTVIERNDVGVGVVAESSAVIFIFDVLIEEKFEPVEAAARVGSAAIKVRTKLSKNQ